MKLPGYLLLLLYLVVINNSRGENTDPKCTRSTEGTEFWFGFMQGRNSHRDHYVEITVTAREQASFSLYIGKQATPYLTGSVDANASFRAKIPLDLAEASGSEKIEDKALHLLADRPVNVYALNWDQNSADVAVIYPVESLGKEYYTMCFTPNVTRLDHGRNTEFMIVPSEDSTLVTITPSMVTDAGKPAQVPFSLYLNKGEVYQVQSLNQPDLPGQGDLTGSFIRADKPVAVYSGTLSTSIPAVAGMSGFDHLYEQIPPINTWGMEYYAVPLINRKMDRYRIMSSEDNTRIIIGNKAPQVIDHAGEYVEFLLYNNEPSRIIADKPVLVAQFSQSKLSDQGSDGDGDPFMIILSPVSQAKNDVTFVAYHSNFIIYYYLNIVVLTPETSNILLDHNPVSNYFKPFPNSKYSYAQVPVSSGDHRLQNINPDRGFIAYVYGYGGYESYGYGVGFNLDLVLDLSKGLRTLNDEGEIAVLCAGDSLTLDAGPYFDYVEWNTNETTQEIEVRSEGRYWAHAFTIDGCHLYDSIDVQIMDPVIRLGRDTLGCPFTRELDAGADFVKYEWNNGETTRKISASGSGDYFVHAVDRYDCRASDTIKIDFYAVPEVKINGDPLVCGSLSGELSATLSGGNTGWSLKSYNWDSDQTTLVFRNESKTSAGYTVKDWGKYNFIYSLTTTDECVVKDSFAAGIYQVPTSDFDFTDNPGDPCQGYSREVLYKGNATSKAELDWDFGACVFDLLDWNRARVSFAPFGSQQPYVTLQVSENGCTGNLTKLTFGASPDFTMTTSKSQACDSDLIQFTGKLNVADVLDFKWDFGDGMTSSEQLPLHLYDQPGFYDVSLLITNPVTGCRAGFLMENMVAIYKTPLARFSVDYPVAIEGQANLSFNNQTMSGELYHWDFGDGYSSEDDNPRHTFDRVGEYMVSLAAESGICRDTSEMIIRILPFNLFTPNAFRPDSDIPENRVFVPFTLGVDPAGFRLQVYNRWGEMIFESKSLDNPWNGKLKNGREAPVGNYIWRADYTDVQGFRHSRKGQVVLIR